MQQQPDVSDLWIQHQRRNNKTTLTWSCTFCPDRKIFAAEPALWEHALADHRNRLAYAEDGNVLDDFRKTFAEECAKKKSTTKDDSELRKPNTVNDVNNGQSNLLPGRKRRLSLPHRPESISGFGALKIGTSQGSDGLSEDGQAAERPQKRAGVRKQLWTEDAALLQKSSFNDPSNIVSIQTQASRAKALHPRQRKLLPSEPPTWGSNLVKAQRNLKQPRKGAAIGDGISAGSASRYRDSSASPPPRRSKGGTISDDEESDMNEIRRPSVALWTENTAPRQTSTFNDPSSIASIQALRPCRRKSLPSRTSPQNARHNPDPSTLGRSSSLPNLNASARDDNCDIIMQPETRPISQEQLVAEVKGIYAGLVMVEAKCIEVDNKQATLAQADPSSQPKLNNEQWQALIALHRTLLHEHHDFFLASQHPSASPALRRLASKYAMPARMWRHGIHSFLELLRHRLPASLDHMLAFIYLAYSMMALLYETVPAFEDTWIECLGDLGRYRMAIEDDDIRDREVWTGVARHWYSKASDKAPTTGRPCHHLAILARPNALQQLFYYAKSLCVIIPFTSARESILTLFEPVLNSDNAHGQYRLLPLDAAFVKAHGLLFTGGEIEKFDTTVKEFLGLLDNQIGRVTRKFMEQGYYIAVANSVAMLGFASKDNPLMQATAEAPADGADVEMVGDESPSTKSFRRAENLSNETLKIALDRNFDPNVRPFIHVTLVFMYHVARHPRAIQLLEGDFPWCSLVVMLNTLLLPYKTLTRITSAELIRMESSAKTLLEDLELEVQIDPQWEVLESSQWANIKSSVFADFKSSEWKEHKRSEFRVLSGTPLLEVLRSCHYKAPERRWRMAQRSKWARMDREEGGNEWRTSFKDAEWIQTMDYETPPDLERSPEWESSPEWTRMTKWNPEPSDMPETWTKFMEEKWPQIRKTQWAQVVRSRLEKIMNSQLAEIEINISKVAQVDGSKWPQLQCSLTDSDWHRIVMWKLKKTESSGWLQIMRSKLRQIVNKKLARIKNQQLELARIEAEDFPIVESDCQPFPEDFAMRGLSWADNYYPEKWFAYDKIDDAEKYHELASMTDRRKERILWLACRLATLSDFISYDSNSRWFSTSAMKSES